MLSVNIHFKCRQALFMPGNSLEPSEECFGLVFISVLLPYVNICIYVLIVGDGLHTVYGYVTKMLTPDSIYVYV